MNVFDALKQVNLREEVNQKVDIKVHEKNKTLRGDAFRNHREGKGTPTIIDSLRLPTPVTNNPNRRNVQREEKVVRRLLEPIKTNERTQWKKRSFLALVDKHRETSKLFDTLKGVGTYSSEEESEDILVKMKPVKHEIHPSVLPEIKQPPALLEQLTER